jgi:hypothetical protein
MIAPPSVMEMNVRAGQCEDAHGRLLPIKTELLVSYRVIMA